MAKRTTIKDIAKQAGVSLGTVHCALAGKTGVGEATRQRILAIAKRNDYRPNAVAASLKRKTVRIAAAFPEPVGHNRFYFAPVWQGVRDHLHAQGDFNIELIELPYNKGFDNRENRIADLFPQGIPDGLLTVGFMDDFGQASLAGFAGLNIPVALVGDDMPQSGRLFCVRPNYDVVGRTLAELVSRQIPGDGAVLVCAGSAPMPSHYQIVAGFDAYMRENGMGNPVYKIHTESPGHEKEKRLARELDMRDDLAACVCVNARGSVVLGRALVETGRAGGLIAVGSDLFAENIAFLRDGVFTNLLNKNPYHQAQMAAKLLIEFVLRDSRPANDTIYVGSEVVFKSALSMYASVNAPVPLFSVAP